MKIEFLSGNCPGRRAAQDHIQAVYRDIYDAQVTEFAPLLVTAVRAGGEILCAAGIRTAEDGFFSEGYLTSDFSTALSEVAGLAVPASDIMEVASLASTTPFPVLPMLDTMIEWGRENGKTCGVFTATGPLRRLLTRTSLSYVELAPADISKVTNPEAWGSYYDTDPRVCAFSEVQSQPALLSPRRRAARLAAKAAC
ncbi:MAG: thermostable hemolysin [Tateyamaria sp.]|uniref:thermostable hemolysin n=1 Tax=Tateyamaria sp. TaxID=1929288 RepID=UPI0032892747